MAGLENFVGSSFGARTTDLDAQQALCRIQGVPTGEGFEEVYGNLSAQDRRAATRSGTREVVFADGNGGIEKIRPDLSGLTRVADAMDTTASASKVARRHIEPSDTSQQAAIDRELA